MALYSSACFTLVVFHGYNKLDMKLIWQPSFSGDITGLKTTVSMWRLLRVCSMYKTFALSHPCLQESNFLELTMLPQS